MKKKWDYEADVVIVGFGGAGGCAAIEACDQGAKVIIIEKQPEERHHSNTRMSGGGFHSPKPSGNRKALKEYAKAMFSGENLPWKLEGEQPDFSNDLAEIWAEYAPQNLDFMQSLDGDFQAVPFGGAAFPEFPGAEESQYLCVSSTYTGEITKEYDNNYNSIHLPKSQQEHGEAFHLCILNGIKNRKIDILYDTRASQLITNDQGRIIGVKAVKEKEEIFYKGAKGVILASGGYEFNPKMRKCFLEGPGVEGWAFYSTTENTGDGIEMGLKVGAGLSKVGKASARLVTAVPIKKNGLKIGLITPSVGKPNEIVVDNYGKRYGDEREITKDPTRYYYYKKAVFFDTDTLDYPRLPSWMIFDENLRTSGPLTRIRLASFNLIPWTYDNMDAIQRGWILKASNFEKLAQKIKDHPDNRGLMDSGVLLDTINKFNYYCKIGKDLDYGRDISTLGPIERPPFYALPLYAGGPNTKGGLLSNSKRQVLDWNGEPIKGLYCAGEISSVFQFVYQAGGNLAECIVFGRIAGQNASSGE